MKDKVAAMKLEYKTKRIGRAKKEELLLGYAKAKKRKQKQKRT